MHNVMHAHGLGSRKGCTWPCLEVPAFREQKVSKIPRQHHLFHTQIEVLEGSSPNFTTKRHRTDKRHTDDLPKCPAPCTSYFVK